MPDRFLALLPMVACVFACTTSADVIRFDDEDRDDWESAVGSFTTIDFAEHPEFTVLTDEYADLGLVFGDPGALVLESNVFPPDEHGIRSADGGLELLFDGPRNALGITFPGGARIRLYLSDRLVGGPISFDAMSFGDFGGLISTEAFDRVEIVGFEPDEDPIFLGDIYFGPVVPAPSAWVVMAGGLVAGRRGRRRTAVSTRPTGRTSWT